MSVKTRCYWYDDDGTPFLRNGGKSGCDRPDCIFTHPWHKEGWRTARKPDTYRCFWYDDDGNPYTHKNGAKGCERETCIFAHPFQVKMWAQSKKGDKLPAEFLLAPEDAERVWGTKPKRPWLKAKESPSKEKRMDEKRSLKDRLSETYADTNVSSRGREKKRARSKSPSESRNRDERYASIRRRSHSPIPKSKVFKDDIWKHRRRMTDVAHHHAHKHHSSRHSLHSIRSSHSPSRDRETSASESRYGRHLSPPKFSMKDKEGPRVPPSGPRALRHREREASPSTPATTPVFTPASSANAIPIPQDARAARQTKLTPSLVPSAKMFAPPQPPIVPTVPNTPQATVSSLLNVEAPGSSTLPDPQGTTVSVTETPSMSRQEIDNILSALRSQNVIPATPTPPLPASTSIPAKTPISFHIPAPAMPQSQVIPIPNMLEVPPVVATASVTPIKTDSAVYASYGEVPQLHDDPAPEVKEESIVSSRAPSVAPEPWSPATQPTDKRKLWAERIKLLSEVVTKQNFLTELDGSLALQTHLADFINALDPSIDKGRFRVEAMSTNVKRMATARDLEEAIEQIGASDVWKLPALEMNEDTKKQRAERLRANMKSRVLLEEVKDLMGNVSTSVRELNRQLKKAGKRKGVVVPSIHGADDDVEMGIEFENNEKKNGPPSGLGSTANTSEIASVLASFEDSLNSLEDRSREVEASLSQRQEEITEEIQASLESQFSDLKAAAAGPSSSLAHASALSEANAERLYMVQADMGKTGEDIGELAQEVASVITQVHEVTERNDKLQKDNKWLKDENDKLRQELAEVKRMQEGQLAKMHDETEKLKSQFQAYIQKQSEPPKLPSVEDILPLILSRIQEALQPRIEKEHGSLQDRITMEMKTCNEDLSKKVETLTGEVKFFEQWADQMKEEVDPVQMLKKLRTDPATSIPTMATTTVPMVTTPTEPSNGPSSGG